jgi:hypothetical protein
LWKTIFSPNIFIVSTNVNDAVVAKVGDFGLAARGFYYFLFIFF